MPKIPGAISVAKNGPSALRVGLVGAGGYSGAELVRLLLLHPKCGRASLQLFSASLESIFTENGRCDEAELTPGKHFADYAVHCPAFYGMGLKIYGLPERAGQWSQWQHFYQSFDIVFLATPHAVSVELATRYFEVQPDTQKLARLIDLSGALRLNQSELYAQWYGEPGLSDSLLRRCQYGLSELFSEAIRAASVIANPGCYATAVTLALAPLFAPESQVTVRRVCIDAKSGSSGAGKQPNPATHFCQTNESLSLYKLHSHQHIPEIEMALLRCAGKPIAPLTFTTHLLPITRGIMATCYIEMEASANSNILDNQQICHLYEHFYTNAPFVQIRRSVNNSGGDSFADIPQIQDVSFSNRCDIGLNCNPRKRGELVVVSVLDNLIKGAAGQAIQNMNLMFGWEESLGLPLAAALP